MFEKIFSSTLPSDPRFPVFKAPHLLPLSMVFLAIILMFLFKKKLQEKKTRRIFMKFFGSSIVIVQFIFFLWYVFATDIALKEGLPLYMCRISSLSLGIILITDNKKMRCITYFWGILGAVIALAIPDTAGRLFPHYMYLQFFYTHGALLAGCLFYLFIDNYRPDINDLFRMVKFTFVYVVFTSLVNMLTGGNYGYLSSPPESISFFQMLPQGIIYKLGITGILLTISGVLYLPFHIRNMRIVNTLKPNEKMI